MPTGDEITDDDIVAWIRGSEIDRSAAYLKRGRAHSSLTDVEVFERWKSAFTEMSSDLGSVAKRSAESDLKSEIDLRGLTAPFEDVSAAMDDLGNRFTAALPRLETDDPERLINFDRSVANMVAAFKSAMQTSGN